MAGAKHRRANAYGLRGSGCLVFFGVHLSESRRYSGYSSENASGKSRKSTSSSIDPRRTELALDESG